MGKIKLIALLVLFGLCFTNCSDDDKENSLNGTKWVCPPDPELEDSIVEYTIEFKSNTYTYITQWSTILEDGSIGNGIEKFTGKYTQTENVVRLELEDGGNMMFAILEDGETMSPISASSVGQAFVKQ